MTASPSSAIKLFGTEEPVTPPRVLKAGPLSVGLDAGNLRFVRLNGVEALRGIAFIVRDKNWGTYNPVLENLKIEEGANHFTVSYNATCKDADQEFRYCAKITGNPDGSLRFEGSGTAETDFLTNRAGFVVLHPITGVSGRPVEVLHVDGSTGQSTFPELIDPVQPFKDIRALTHEVMPGVKVTCTMEGDTFEMEDHRQWGDASYKTYVRPIGLPWPFTIKAGETTTQSVMLTVAGTLPGATSSAAAAVKIAVGGEAGTVPRFGLGLEPQHAEASLEVADLVKRVGPQVIVCWFDPRAGHGVEDMKRYQALAEAVGAEPVLEAVVSCVEDYQVEINRIAEQAAQAEVTFAAVSFSPAAYLKSIMPGSDWPDVPPLEAIYDAGRAAFPGVTLGGGMFSYFTELNRKPPPVEHLDYITHTSSVIVHACDDITVTENLEALPHIIKTTRSFSAGKPYRVGPSAIGMRDNPYGATTMDNPHNGRIAMARMDPRQRGLICSAWNVGYVAHMARGGLEVITLSAPVGEFGIIYHRMDYAQPGFDEASASVYPAYHVVAGMAAAAGAPMLTTTSSVSHDVECIAYRSGDETTLWIANLTGEERQVEIEGLPATQGTVRMLDEASFEQCVAGSDGFDATARSATLNKLTLAPYAVARLDASG